MFSFSQFAEEWIRENLCCEDAATTGLPDAPAPVDPPFGQEAQRERFNHWLDSACTRHSRLFGGVGRLHLAFCEWETASGGFPCDRETFLQLLREANLFTGEISGVLLVSGLSFRDDLEANRSLIAQTDTAVIHIRIIDGRTGRPMKVQKVGLEDRAGYRDISVRPDAAGVATLRINRDAIILTHNTHEYVDCGDERGGLVHNDYKVSEIVSTGLVERIEQPNLCAKGSGSARPGELILFVRPWRTGEDM